VSAARRAGQAASLAIAATAVLAVPGPGTATAQAANVSCQAGGTAQFDPGLLPAPPRETNVQYRGQQRSCNGQSPNGSEIVSARFNGAITVPMSCVGGGSGNPASGFANVEWRTKEGETLKSTLTISISGQVLNEATVEGNVTDGAFSGAVLQAQFRVDLAREGINCASHSLTGGLRQAPFFGNFSLTG
jgi:hypothetical protein